MTSRFLKLFIIFIVWTYPSLGWSYDEDSLSLHTSLTADGPYIIYGEDGTTKIISVDEQGKIQQQKYGMLPDGFKVKIISSDGKHRFEVPLHPVERQSWKLKQAKKLFVMSDPHGNLDCVVNLLHGNGIINDKYQWIYGKNQLIILGDVFDRGNDAPQIFWLIYKLEHEAEQAGGKVIFTLGNHESMVLMNDLRYTEPKYKALAKRLRVRYSELFGMNTELGRWLCSRNTIELIGNNLLLHAGLSRLFYLQQLSIPWVNQAMERGLYKVIKERKADNRLTYFLYSSNGPIWYRGMVEKDNNIFVPLTSDTLNLILKKYHAERIIVGHTIFPDITSVYDGRVLTVNVDNALNRAEKKGRAILFKKKHIYVVGDNGIIRVIK